MATSDIEDIWTQVKSDVEDLNLEGISAPGQIFIQKVLSNRKDDIPTRPAILIAPFGNLRWEPWSNAQYLIRYPTAIVAIQPSNQDQDLNRSRITNWSEDIRRKFGYKRLGTVTDVGTTIAPREMFDANAFFGTNYDVSGAIFMFGKLETPS